MSRPLDSSGERILLALSGDQADAAGELTRSAPVTIEPLPRITARVRRINPTAWGEPA